MRPPLPRPLVPSLALTLLVGLAGCSWGFLRGYAEASSRAMDLRLSSGQLPTGMLRFAFDDIGALNTDATETHAVPWKILVAALVLDARERVDAIPLQESSVLPILEGFGFLFPDTILNAPGWDAIASPPAPLGLNRGIASRSRPRVEAEIVNLGCAACHSGVLYDATGAPRNAVWLGLPNTSLDLDALADALYRGFLLATERPGEFRAAIDSIYPDLPSAERRTLDDHILPTLSERVAHAREAWGRLTPYAPGGAGAANGVGSVRHVFGLLPPGGGLVGVGGAVSTPDLGDRLLKSSFASDGSFGVPGQPRSRAMGPEALTDAQLDAQAGVIAFFAVSTMGVRPERVGEIIPRVRDILDFLRDYRPPPFPGPVDMEQAARGEALFAARCSGCHGEYSPLPDPRLVSYPNRVIPAAEIGTDPVRWLSATPELAAVIQSSPAEAWLAVGPTAGYVPPPLTGVWATAPYLHNGSVPTVWHLMFPESRPARFLTGGHALDFSRLGIAGELDDEGTYRYPAGYRPWSTPSLYDTALPGQNNRGHEAPFRTLGDSEKRALIEYLKLL